MYFHWFRKWWEEVCCYFVTCDALKIWWFSISELIHVVRNLWVCRSVCEGSYKFHVIERVGMLWRMKGVVVCLREEEREKWKGLFSCWIQKMKEWGKASCFACDMWLSMGGLVTHKWVVRCWFVRVGKRDTWGRGSSGGSSLNFLA
jgi:hypothetical protein